MSDRHRPLTADELRQARRTYDRLMQDGAELSTVNAFLRGPVARLLAEVEESRRSLFGLLDAPTDDARSDR